MQVQICVSVKLRNSHYIPSPISRPRMVNIKSEGLNPSKQLDDSNEVVMIFLLGGVICPKS